MRFARRLVLLPLLSLLAACSPTTPLFVAQVTTGEVAEYKQMKSNRMTAAIEEEGDLLTYSAMAIRDNRSAEAEKLYLTGYEDMTLDDIKQVRRDFVDAAIRARYKANRDAMAEGLKKHLPPGCVWQSPKGGMFFWIRLPEGVSAVELASRAAAQGVLIEPGDVFFHDASPPGGYIRLGYQSIPAKAIEAGIRILAGVIAELQRGR